MMNEVRVQNERVDDIPVLVKQQEDMGIAEVINEVVKRHGNRAGLSVGWTVVGWLTFILSASDHRLNRVEGWAEGRLVTLNGVLPGPVQASDFTDDRLADVLRMLLMTASAEGFSFPMMLLLFIHLGGKSLHYLTLLICPVDFEDAQDTGPNQSPC